VLGVGTDKRFFPAMQELARLAVGGSLGPPLHVEAHFSNEVAARRCSRRGAMRPRNRRRAG